MERGPASARKTGRPDLHVVSAGAGSGKTTFLAGEVERAIAAGTAPEGILLTTFTRKAAAELEERVRGKLFEKGRHAEAWRLRQAWIGTVDSVCLQLLQEYAFEVGESPELSVLGEGEDVVHFNRALGDVLKGERQDELRRLSERLSFEARDDESLDWRTLIKNIADAARSNRIAPAALADSRDRSLQGILGLLPPVGDADAIDGALVTEVDRACPALEEMSRGGGDSTQATRNALGTVRQARGTVSRNVAWLKWSEWASLAKLAPGKKSAHLVEGLREAATRNAEHPRLREDITRFVTLLFDTARDSLERYQARKKAIGVLDFVDLEEKVLRLLENEAVRRSLGARLELVLVDEFQDTSPIQLALFLELGRLAQRSVWVGDQKQCIFEFRGADPLLMGTVLEEVKDGDRLGHSYRSRPELVDLVNRSFAEVFPGQGIHDVTLEPKRKDHLPSPAWQSWVLPGGRARVQVDALARHVARLLARPEAHPVLDKRSQSARGLLPRDVCVLARTNSHAVAVAAALAGAGVPVELQRPGLLGCLEVELALSGLRLLIDPWDALAAARIVFLRTATGGARETFLERRLAALAELEDGGEKGADGDRGEEDADDAVVPPETGGHDAAAAAEEAGGPGEDGRLSPGLSRALAGFLDDEVVRDLVGLTAEARTRDPVALLELAIERSRVHEMCERWGQPGQRLANLEKLLALCREVLQVTRARGEPLAAAGLVAHLEQIAEEGEDVQATGGADAVRVATYHAAKGLEWPVVILTELNKRPERSVFDVAVEGAESFSLDDPLGGRWIRYWPWPYGSHRIGLALVQAADATREMERARTRSIREATRLLYVGMTRARDTLVFAAARAKSGRSPAWLEVLRDGEEEPTFVLPQDEEPEVVAIDPLAPAPDGERTTRWFAGADAIVERPPGVVLASELRLPEEREAAVVVTAESIGPRRALASGADMQKVGNAVHAYLAVDVSRLGEEEKIEIAGELLEAHEVGDGIAAGDVVAIGEGLREFLEARWPGAVLHREWPVALRIETEHGDVELHGTADLVLETKDGFVVVDHKTFPGGERELTEKARGFAGQLAAYRRAIEEATKKEVLGTFVHFPVSGWWVGVETGGVGVVDPNHRSPSSEPMTAD